MIILISTSRNIIIFKELRRCNVYWELNSNHLELLENGKRLARNYK